MGDEQHGRGRCIVGGTERLFSVLSASQDAAGLSPLIRFHEEFQTPCPDYERLWSVWSSVKEVVRYSAAPVDPLTISALTSDDDVSSRSALLLELVLTHQHGNRVLRVDLGQTLEVYARQVVARVVAPQLSSPAISAGPESGLVADTIATLAISEIDSSVGARTALLTQTVALDPDQPDLVIAVPTAARSLTIYASTPSVSVQGSWWRGEPSTGIEIGAPFVPGNGDRMESPTPSASHLTLTPDGIVVRPLSLVWEVAP